MLPCNPNVVCYETLGSRPVAFKGLVHESIVQSVTEPRDGFHLNADEGNPRIDQRGLTGGTLRGIPRSPRTIASIALLAFIAWIDWATGPEIHFSLFYVIPVLLTAWFVGGRAGYAMAVLSAGVRLWVDLRGHGDLARASIAYWNTSIRLACFLAASGLLSAFKNLRDRLESRVVERTRSLRLLGAQLSETEALERRRLAHDIHDDFGQTLTALKLNLAATLAGLPEGTPARQHAGEAVKMVTDVIHRSRTLTFDLHPTMLEHLGIVATLRHFAAEFHRRTGVEMIVNEEGMPGPLPELIAGYLFRSVKELVTNAAKHGLAGQIILSIYWGNQRLRIIVDDDGSGFDPATRLAPGVKGLGLAGIRERMLTLDGTMRLESDPGHGARVVMELPYGVEESAR